MGREVRLVPKDWEHPKDTNGRYIPLYYDYKDYYDEYVNSEQEKEAVANWEKGLWFCYELNKYVSRDEENKDTAYKDWHGEYLEEKDFMSHYYENWANTKKDHLQMYEDTSEGTPISPVFDNADDLAQWLADNKASAFGSWTATKEQWLHTINRGYAVSAVVENGRIVSGVEHSPPSDKEE